jgi:NADH-quinone oxidoreductase subunit E
MNLETEVWLEQNEIEELCGGAGADITPERLIPILQNVQDKCNYLPEGSLRQISDYTSIPLSKIFGVATFYEQFHLKPRGKHIVKCCRGTACHVKGAMGIAEAIEKILGISDGETTEDLRFTFETVACLGTCALAPVMMVDDVYHGKMTPKSIKKVLENITSSKEID